METSTDGRGTRSQRHGCSGREALPQGPGPSLQQTARGQGSLQSRARGGSAESVNPDVHDHRWDADAAGISEREDPDRGPPTVLCSSTQNVDAGDTSIYFFKQELYRGAGTWLRPRGPSEEAALGERLLKAPRSFLVELYTVNCAETREGGSRKDTGPAVWLGSGLTWKGSSSGAAEDVQPLLETPTISRCSGRDVATTPSRLGAPGQEESAGLSEPEALGADLSKPQPGRG
ncbi:hypothetical protein CB1_000186004 [Camelus ferus]|nr:hypothetical protein CB1_000186004 [Camelus ferus]